MRFGRLPGRFPVQSTLATSTRSTPTSVQQHVPTLALGHGHQEFTSHTDGPPTSIVINISDGGSTGRGILIGLLSAFGSAGIAVLVLAIFFFFKYTSSGRIILDRIGRPGEFDDEQAFAREEAEALEGMDDLQRTEYMRAKGKSAQGHNTRIPLTDTSIHPCEPSRDRPYRYIIIAVLSHTRERCLGLGIRARTRDRQLLRRSSHRD